MLEPNKNVGSNQNQTKGQSEGQAGQGQNVGIPEKSAYHTATPIPAGVRPGASKATGTLGATGGGKGPVSGGKGPGSPPGGTGRGPGTGSGGGNEGPTGSVILGEANKGWNAIELYRSGLKVSPGRAHPNPPGTRTLKNIVPYVGSRSILFQFLHTGVTLPWMVYQADLFFSTMEFSNDPAKINDREWMEIKYKDLQVYMKKINLNHNRIHIRCSCPDFYFTYAYYDYNTGALFGSKPKRYVRKTIWRPDAPIGQRGYPPRNPDGHSGFCRHIRYSIELAQQNGWILPSPRLA